MNRYRSYGQLDDPPTVVGDPGFLGVNQYDTPENLQPGQVQNAVNIDFSSGDAATRGGFVCLPELGVTPFEASSRWVSRDNSDTSGYLLDSIGNNLATSGGDKFVFTTTKVWSAVAYGAGRFVAVSNAGCASNDVMWSSDTVVWNFATTNSLNNWSSIAYGNGVFVAVGPQAPVVTSSDGIDWTARTSAATLSWTSVTFGDNLFVAVASDGGSQQVMTSPDGITWTRRSTPALAQNNWTSVDYGNGLYVAVASSGTGNRVMTSSDGITWAAQTSAADLSWTGVAFGNNRFVAVASDSGTGSVMTSTDGSTWVQRTSISGTWSSIAYGNALFVAVSSAGGSVTDKVMTSPDGATWTATDAASLTPWKAVANGGNNFVAVGDGTTYAPVMASGATNSVFASGVYSDPDSPDDNWVVIAGPNQAGFYSFGRTSRTVAYPTNYEVTQQATMVQANNQLFIFPGVGQTPIYWDGDWNNAVFVEVPDTSLDITAFESIPESNHATYYQNRLWVVNGKDNVAASDALDFTSYDLLANDFNLNTGSADYVVNTYPFGDNSLVVFKHNSIILLQDVQGSLNDVTTTEVSRNLGIVGINAVTAVGPDLVYFSDRNVSTIQLNLQNRLQGATEPLSRNINPIINRVNWAYSYKISMGYWNNLLYIALPLDDATVCSSIIVYNFITKQWYGEWNFDPNIDMAIQGFVVANYLGQSRLHVVTDDGRIFVTDGGQNDISGTTVAEIATELVSRAYATENDNHVARRAYLDLSTNRPNYSVVTYCEGAGQFSNELTNQTYSRASSWRWNDSTYDLTNANDDYNRAYRKDYSSGPASIQCGTGFQPEMTQDFRLPLITRRRSRLSWIKITNSTGFLKVNSIGFETRPGDRTNLIQVG